MTVSIVICCNSIPSGIGTWPGNYPYPQLCPGWFPDSCNLHSWRWYIVYTSWEGVWIWVTMQKKGVYACTWSRHWANYKSHWLVAVMVGRCCQWVNHLEEEGIRWHTHLWRYASTIWHSLAESIFQTIPPPSTMWPIEETNQKALSNT